MSNTQVNIDNKNVTTTTNGMVTNDTTLNNCVDLFFSIGAMRGKPREKLIKLFRDAYEENPLVSTKLLFWSRDVRGGSGERKIFRDILTFLSKNSPNTIKKNIHLIPEFGRWDDVLTLVDSELEVDAFTLISEGLINRNGLCAKWMPRKGVVANKLRKFLKMNPKQYRKTLVELTNVVETKMCAKDWESIDYSKLPSLASSKYQKSFNRNDGVRYEQYKNALIDGTAKVNAGAVYPYDIIKSMRYGGGDDVVNNKQWESQPNFMEGSIERIIPVVDVSGSMGCKVGENPNLTCMDVAISLGIYISERSEGSFKDAFITFSQNPKLQYLKGNLRQRLGQLQSADWGMSTNLQSVFELILRQAKHHNISEDMMPTKILILSDMQFNSAISDSNLTAQGMIKQMYEDAGYKLPDVVFWNLNASNSNFPVKFNESGTALVSGFSPSILKSILGGKNFNPESIMFDTINNDRYNLITV